MMVIFQLQSMKQVLKDARDSLKGSQENYCICMHSNTDFAIARISL